VIIGLDLPDGVTAEPFDDNDTESSIS